MNYPKIAHTTYALSVEFITTFTELDVTVSVAVGFRVPPLSAARTVIPGAPIEK